MRLIDADALKNELTRLGWTEENGFKNRYVLDDIIDNAPTEPQVTVFAENASEEETEDFKQELENVLERPQGEWILLKGYDYKCNLCGNSMMDKWNFCPDCGADMRGEEE